jgi:nicotinamidase-related amidase
MATHTHLLDRSRATLLVVDVQERINAVMADPSHLSRLSLLVGACALLGVPVVASEQYPQGLGQTVPELAERLPARPLVKLSFSCARDPQLLQALASDGGRRQVVVTGIEAHVCVLQTALDLLRAGFEVHVPHDATNSRRTTDKEWSLRRMIASGVVITSTESALFELLENCATDDFRRVSKMLKGVPV